MSIMDAVREYETLGYRGQFAAAESGEVRCLTCDEEHPAERVQRTSLRRVEGSSEPDEMVSINALICPGCGAKGTAVFKYGPGATPEEGEIMSRLNAVHQGSAHLDMQDGYLLDPGESRTPLMPSNCADDVLPATPHTGEGPILEHQDEER